MANTLTTIDGKMHVVIDSRDVNDIIREYMGDDIFRYISYDIEKKDEEIQELRTELEFAYDGQNRFLNDIKDVLNEVKDLLNKERVDKRKMRSMISELYNDIMREL